MTTKNQTLFSFLRNYWVSILFLVLVSLSLNALGLVLPKVTSRAVDAFTQDQIYNFTPPEAREANYTYKYSESAVVVEYMALGSIILIFGLIQTFAAASITEKIAFDLRAQLTKKISQQSFGYLQKIGSGKIITNLTSDINVVKEFISQGIVFLLSAIVLLFGSALIMLSIDWTLALPILLVVPIIIVFFGLIFTALNKYFALSQKVIDALNYVINDTVVGAALVRVLSSGRLEQNKYELENTKAKDLGIKITLGFAGLVPFISLMSNLAILIVVRFGGEKLITGNLTTGQYTEFLTYVSTFIFPIIILGFLGSIIARAFTSFGRISEVINSEITQQNGTIKQPLSGSIEFKDVSLSFDEKQVLKNVSFSIKASQKVGIIGPTASGKTQLFNLIVGLSTPTSGQVLIDGVSALDYDQTSLMPQIGTVFQDSLLFNNSIKENIVLDNSVSDQVFETAVQTAEVDGFVHNLTDGYNTIVSERGTSLSGGQKQRVMLARALALQPKVMLLDDFTARVDRATEGRIFENLNKNYQDSTLLLITQKIESVQNFDVVMLLMEGELLAVGTHAELLNTSVEYKQIYESQQTLNND